jgi:hypothetical protein
VLGLLEPAGAKEPDGQAGVQQANALISEHFDSRFFWDLRYRRFPERGSGVGSRGENLAYKRALLRVEGVEAASSVLDVGCGDLEVVGTLDISNYVGIDQALHSLALARSKRPDWTFVQAPADQIEPADFVICFEVAIHQPSYAEYQGLIDLVSSNTKRCLIISGYDDESYHVAANHMIFFHEPLSQSIAATGRFASIRKIGAHSDVVIYRCDVI